MHVLSRAVAASVFAASSAAAQASNLGFEVHANGRPTGWPTNGAGYEIVVDSSAPFAGRSSLRTRWIDAAAYVPSDQRLAVSAQQFPISLVRGRKLHLTGYIRTQGVSTGYAGFWMRVDGPTPQQSLALDNMSGRGPRNTTGWTRYEIELPVDSGASGVVFGVLHPGDGTAWFDSITVEVVGDAMPRMVAATEVVPRPSENMTRFLTDAELAFPADPMDAADNPLYTDWVKSNARPIRSLGSSEFSDLEFFAPLLANKRIVQLGESGHGVAEFNLAKVRLIKYLHEKLGYDVLAFESSTYECERAQKHRALLSAVELMRACIFAVWHTEETLPLFEYIKQTQNTPRPLILAGFDEQTSSQSVVARPGVFRSAVAAVDSTYAHHVYLTDREFVANRVASYATANRARLVPFYDSLATFLHTHRKAIEAAHREDPNIALVTRQAARSMTAYVRQLATEPSNERTEIRDRAMADNLDFLLNELYPGKKVIVWAHNFHIQHRENTQGVASDTANRQPRTTGVWVAERHRRELYTIGLFMYSGSAMTNTRQPYNVVRPRPGSIESILHRAPWRYSYVDFSQAGRSPGSEWLWTRLNVLSWGMHVERIVPRDEYDGVLFIDKVHVPTYR